MDLPSCLSYLEENITIKYFALDLNLEAKSNEGGYLQLLDRFV